MEAGKTNEKQQQQQGQLAPFVAKTYQMVSDPRTDLIIRWGRMNNSFMVLDPATFSNLLLPSFFKHSNFSSFIRQLNTYGFRKVDPDRWEFAHESFLRGQVYLLPQIVRRRKKDDVCYVDNNCDRKEGMLLEDDEEEEVLLKEIGRLRREQTAMDTELQEMNRRLEITERRPHQMMTFLSRVAEDPGLITKLVISKQQHQQQKRQRAAAGEKRRRVVITAPLLPSLPQATQAQTADKAIAPPPVLETLVPSFELCPFPQQISSYSFNVAPGGGLVSVAEGASASSSSSGYSGFGFDDNEAAAGSPCVPEIDGSGGSGGGGDGDSFGSGSSMLLLPEIEVPGPLAAFPFSLLGHGFIQHKM